MLRNTNSILKIVSPNFCRAMHVFNGNSRILKWRYCTICLAIFWVYIPLHRPYIGLIYGRYLQFRFLKWPLMFFSHIWRNGIWQLWLTRLATTTTTEPWDPPRAALRRRPQRRGKNYNVWGWFESNQGLVICR